METHRNTRSGLGLVELMISVTLFTVVLLASMTLVDSGRRFSRATMQITSVEDLAQQMLFKMEKELANAAGVEPKTSQPSGSVLDAAETAQLESSDNVGFPPRGMLLIDRGEDTEERISYTSLSADHRFFLDLTRGESCTQPVSHDADLYWAGLAEPLEVQEDPPVAESGRALAEDGSEILFSGDGFGFTYRVPVDPSGENNFIDGNQLRLGADVLGIGPTENGWNALVFVPKNTYDESETDDDLNRDGDTDDVYDIGQIRRLTWAHDQPTQVEEIGMGPSNILQERCNWGGDLDGDTFDDPIFLWNRDTNLLEVRLFLLGRSNEDMPIVRSVQSVMFLRNEPEL